MIVNAHSYLFKEPSPPYLSFISRDGGAFTLRAVNKQDNQPIVKKTWDGTMYYSQDRINWSVWNGSSTSSSNDGKLYIRGKNNTYITGSFRGSGDDYYIVPFAWEITPASSSTLIDCSGNIENILDWEQVDAGIHPTMDQYVDPTYPSGKIGCFESLFSGDTALASAPELPAQTLSEKCYRGMFYRCTSLTEAPELPSIHLKDNCYESMFENCTSLVKAPNLPTTVLDDWANNAYASMFRGCTSLQHAPALPITNLYPAFFCYESMFSGCTSLREAPELPATVLNSSCYLNMFNDCIYLTEMPDLPAMEVPYQGYKYMFRGCINITQATAELPATTLGYFSYESMFAGCIRLTTAPALPATVLQEGCYEGMFNGCTSLRDIPALPATAIPAGAYVSMFKDCSSVHIYTSQDTGRTLYLGTDITYTYSTSATDMFKGTGGDFTGTPVTGPAYYTTNAIIS